MNQRPDDQAARGHRGVHRQHARAEKVARAAREKKVTQAEQVEAPAE